MHKRVAWNKTIQEENWTTERRASSNAAKETLDNAVTLACPKIGWQTLMFPDANCL